MVGGALNDHKPFMYYYADKLGLTQTEVKKGDERIDGDLYLRAYMKGWIRIYLLKSVGNFSSSSHTLFHGRKIIVETVEQYSLQEIYIDVVAPGSFTSRYFFIPTSRRELRMYLNQFGEHDERL